MIRPRRRSSPIKLKVVTRRPPPVRPAASGKLDQGLEPPTLVHVAGRLFTWAVSLGAMLWAMLLDRLQRRSSKALDAKLLRRTLESLGPSAIKIGQQLSVRTDLIPKEYSDELIGLLDDLPPFPLETGRRIVEEELGRPIAELFSEFDPNPIGSASIAVVYKAVLPSGEPVAVKVRRPEVSRLLAADLRAIGMLCDIGEMLGAIERGKSRPILYEFRRMLLDELNFLVEARQTDLFREDAEDSNRFVSAPRVYWDLTTRKVLVTEFIKGIFLKQVVAAIEHNDQAWLDRIAAEGYDLTLITRRLINVFYWQLFENTFFHADPHPSNVIFLPDCTIVLIDFGATGTVTAKYRRDLLRFVRSLAAGDVDGMVRHMIASLEPLPPLINLEAYKNEMYDAMREYLFTAKSRLSSWQERSSGRAMMAISDISRRYRIPIRPDVLRYMRASFQFDSIVYRLDPTLDSRKEFKRYWSQRIKQANKKLRKRRRRWKRDGLAAAQNMLASIQERFADVDALLAFLGKHVPQLEGIFRRRVDPIARAIGAVVHIFQYAAVAGLAWCLFVWGSAYHPHNFLSRWVNRAGEILFGQGIHQIEFVTHPISQRWWIWIIVLAAFTAFSAARLRRVLLTPATKLEQ